MRESVKIVEPDHQDYLIKCSDFLVAIMSGNVLFWNMGNVEVKTYPLRRLDILETSGSFVMDTMSEPVKE